MWELVLPLPLTVGKVSKPGLAQRLGWGLFCQLRNGKEKESGRFKYTHNSEKIRILREFDYYSNVEANWN